MGYHIKKGIEGTTEYAKGVVMPAVEISREMDEAFRDKNLGRYGKNYQTSSLFWQP